MKHYCKYILIVIFLSLITTSCHDWLEVKPRTEIKSSDNFENAQGFKDALTGVYMIMSQEALYGRELSFGMLDVLAMQYTQAWTTTIMEYYYISRHNYTGQTSKNKIAAVWSGMYNVIANLNNLIYYIDEADPNIFQNNEYHIIKGEAYALRAFIHFDLLRMFGTSYLVGADTKSIPYVTVYNSKVTPLSTVREVIDKALADLNISEQELRYDPVIDQKPNSDFSNYLRDRHYKFNYYAVKLLQARILLYKGDHRNALTAAEEVIGQTRFTWVPPTEITTSSKETRNMVFWQELLFTLNIKNIADIAFGTSTRSSWFSANPGFNKSTTEYSNVYEVTKYPNDYRYLYASEIFSSNRRISLKLYQSATNNSVVTASANKMPIMRLSEAYYIAAECLLNLSDKQGALDYLDIVRQHRGIDDPLPETLSPDQVQDEIFKEYVKEFVCEGQLFYYYKRLNSSTIQYYIPSETANPPVPQPVDSYVFPLPDDEVEFGQRYLD
jgi:hypothetical protein